LDDESRWACPVCGAHRLAMEELPRVGAMGSQPYSDILGMGDPGDHSMPAIVCLACSTRWPNAEAFWADARDRLPGAADGTVPPAPGDAAAANGPAEAAPVDQTAPGMEPRS
jgi:hypothetical protein